MTAVPIDGFRHREPLERRTYNECRRGSRPHDPNARYPTLSRKEADIRRMALTLHMEQQRKEGRRNGAPGTICEGAPRLYNAILNMAVKFSGRAVRPSVETLARMLGVTKKAVHRWKAQLQAFGFLDWERETLPTGLDGIRGPQVKQTSNAYVATISNIALELVARVRAKMGKKRDPRTVEPHELDVMTPAARGREARLAARQAEDRANLARACASLPEPRSSG